MPGSKNVALQVDSGPIQQEAGFGFLGNFAFQSVVDGLVAKAGGGIAGATPISAMLNRVATVATLGDSCLLPAAFQGLSIAVLNDGTNAMQVFAQGADTVNAIAGATGIQQMAKSLVWYTCHADGKWIANGIGSGFAGSQMTFSTQDNIAAHAGGGQGAATPLTASYNRVTAVATIADSVVLMASAAGMEITVTNAAVNSMNVFPATGEIINALGANAAFAVGGGKTATFFCATAGQWHAMLSA